MDPNIIYFKTASGEEAIQQRTRVIQRNVRMVLILVDGQSSVADLCRKTGNPQLTENALTELEKGGFIELKEEQQDSLWEESKRISQEIRSAAMEKTLRFSTQEKDGCYPDFKQSFPPAHAVPELKSQMSDMPISMHSVFDARDAEDFSISQFSIKPSEQAAGSKEAYQPLESARAEKNSQHNKKVKKNMQLPKPSILAQVKSLWASADRDLYEEKIKVKPILRRSKSRAGWPLITFISLTGLLCLGFLALLFFPFQIYLPEVEAALSRSIGRPVKVGAMRVDVYPVAGLILANVRTGVNKQELLIGEIHLQPDWTTLFSPHKNFRKVVLRGMELPLELVAGMPGIFSSLANSKNSVGVGQIYFEKTDISFGGLAMKDIEADVRLDPKGTMQSLDMRTPDRSLNIVAAPVPQGVNLTVEAYTWRPFQDSKLVFDSASFKGNLENGTLAITRIDLRLLDGVIQGNATIRADTKPNLSGDIRFERINMSRLGDALDMGKRMAGETVGKMRFAAKSDTWSKIFSSVHADGDFTIQRGNISGIDLAEAVRRISGTPVQGGMTSFEQLSGRMRLTPEKNQFSGLVINSGLMQSTGHLDVAKNHKLSGRLELQMKGSVNQTRVPVLIDGTLDSPTVQARRG